MDTASTGTAAPHQATDERVADAVPEAATGPATDPGRRRALGLIGAGALTLAGAATGSLSVASAASAAAGPPPSRLPVRPPAVRRPAAGGTWTTQTLLTLLSRATYGLTPELVAEAKAMGPDAWLAQQLAPASIDDHLCDGYVARFPSLGWSIATTRAQLGFNGGWDVMWDLAQATVLRAVWSRRQLFEVMVDFWSNHLNVTNPSSDVWESRHRYDADVIRRFAFGKYHDMLVASASHPSMLNYLNNADSTKDAPNENYGRELLELHTVGVDGGYDEVDMHQSAMVFTGWGIYRNWQVDADPLNGTFEYHPDDHYVGPVSVMGWSSANATAAGGQAVALDYLHYLSHHPSTAKRIATKLCQRFVCDDPPADLVARLAAVYLANDTAILPVLREVLSPRSLVGHGGTKLRRPMENVVASARALGVRPQATGTDGFQQMYWVVDSCGQAPGAWPQPNGYPDVATSWASASGTLAQWNTHLDLAGGWWPNAVTYQPLSALVPSPLPATYGALLTALQGRLLFAAMAPAHRSAWLGFFSATESTPLHSGDAVLSWQLPYAVALLLDSPYFAAR